MERMDELMEIEEQFWTKGADYYRDMLADEFLMVLPEVGFLRRGPTIDAVAKGERWQRVTIAEPHLTRIAEGAAVLSYRAAASRDSGDTRYEALVSSVYVEHADGWKLAFHQQTPGG